MYLQLWQLQLLSSHHLSKPKTMSKLLPRFLAVILAIGCCSQGWAQISIDASCETTTVQCLADLDDVACPDAPNVLGAEGEVIGTASCLLVSERDSNREI